MVYLKSVENVITLGKLIGLLFLFCLPLLSILFLKTKRNDLARPVMGTIFLVAWLGVLYVRYSMRGMVKGLIRHEAKQSALLVSRPYPSASRSTTRTGHLISYLLLMHGWIV